MQNAKTVAISGSAFLANSRRCTAVGISGLWRNNSSSSLGTAPILLACCSPSAITMMGKGQVNFVLWRCQWGARRRSNTRPRFNFSAKQSGDRGSRKRSPQPVTACKKKMQNFGSKEEAGPAWIQARENEHTSRDVRARMLINGCRAATLRSCEGTP